MRRRYRIVFLVAAAAAVTAGVYLSTRFLAPAVPAAASKAQEAAQDGGAAAPGVEKASARRPGRKGPVPGNMMPPPFQPLTEVFDDLQARANAGDVEAATRLYRDLSLCKGSQQTMSALVRSSDEVMGAKLDTMEPTRLQYFQNELDSVELNQQALQNLHRLCDGVGDGALDRLIPNLRKAAELGESYARACYLQRGPSYDMRALTREPALLETYRGEVSSLIEAGMADGDWRVVDVLRDAYQPGSRSMLGGMLGADAQQYYRYLKLYRLGAEPYRVEQIDEDLAAAAKSLTPAQLAEADGWAQDTFQQKFHGSGGSTEQTIPGWDPCSFP
jgi:hypothetical protein